MKSEYDFSNAERGKFYREKAKLHLPVYLDDEIRDWLQRQAQSRGIDMNELINKLLRQDIKHINASK